MPYSEPSVAIAKTMVSVDFFTVPTISFQVLYVFLGLAHDWRRIVHFTARPTAEWTAQQLRGAFPVDEIPRYPFQRIFGATIFFGTDIQRDRAALVMSRPE